MKTKKKCSRVLSLLMSLMLAAVFVFSGMLGNLPVVGSELGTGKAYAAEDALVVGEGKDKSDIPYCAYYNNGGSQTIYTADELGNKKGDILSIAYYADASTSNETTSVKIYLAHTDKSKFSSDEPLKPLDEWQLVYSGNPTLGEQAGWEIRDFDEPFTYNGEDNLIVLVLRQHNTWKEGVHYRYTKAGGMVLYSQNDEVSEPYASPEGFKASASCYVSDARPNTRFVVVPAKFTTDPTGFSYRAGGPNTKSLTAVAVTSDDSVSCRWYKSNRAGLRAKDLDTDAVALGTAANVTAAGGTVTMSYTPTTADLGEDIGTFYYYCAVTDSTGMRVSRPAVIGVYTSEAEPPKGKPVIESDPAAIEGKVVLNDGMKAAFTAKGVEAAKEGDELHYQWFIKADGESDFAAIKGATDATYTAKGRMNKTDTYRYEVRASREVPSNISPHLTSTEISVTGKPHTISTEEELRAFAESVNEGNDYSGGTITLTDDIELTGEWIPIGDSEYTPFRGTFDGDGHTISGLSIEDTGHNNKALFGFAADGAVIRNFVVQGSVSCYYTGAGVIANANGNILVENVGSKVDVNTVFSGAAGIIAYSYYGGTHIRSCYNKGSITTHNGYAGGIFGGGYSNITIDSCYNLGSVTNEMRFMSGGSAGGIAGRFWGSDNIVYNCINAGTVVIDYEYIEGKGAISGTEFSAIEEAADSCYYLEGSCDRVSYNSPTVKNVHVVTAGQLAGSEAFNGALLLDALNVGKYKGMWIDGASLSTPQDCPALSWEGHPHKWTAPVYTWSSDNSKCTAERSCINMPTHKQSETVTATSKVTKEPTLNEDGARTFRAEFENPAFTAQTKTVVIPKLSPGGGDPTNQLGADGTALGVGASAEAADKAITSLASDKDPKGAVFGKLQLKSTSQKNTSVKIAWKKLSGATNYVVYGNICGSKNKMKKLVTLSGTSKNFTEVAGKKVKKGTYYKFIVVALDKNNKVLSTSKIIHVATKGGKVGNHKSLTVKAKVGNKTKTVKKLTISKGKSTKLVVTQNLVSKKMKAKKHVGVRYESSDPKIATVSKAGKITAKAKGSCTIYVYAQNGVMKAVKVTVK